MNKPDKLWKKIPLLAWLGENVGLIILILKYKLGRDVLHMDERADPEADEWKDNPWQHVFNLRRDSAVEHSKGRIALDLCCGTGWTSHAMSMVANQVTAVDYSSQTISAAQNRYSQSNLNFKQMDALNLEFETESFETVVCMEAIEHFTEEDGLQLIKEAHRVLKNGGIFIGSTPAVENRSPLKLYSLQLQDPYHLFLYSKSILEKTLLQVFSEVEVVSQDKEWLLFTCKKN